ncbi:MAG TPA: response regulator transcription factor [Chloroflexi bacterium]|nr:response regulator transcription factor [Chloroflexota bacterium]
MPAKKNAPTSALILARPGRLRDSLGALLTSMPQIQRVNSAEIDNKALELFTDPPPNLIVIDTNLMPNRLSSTLEQIKARWPQARYVILVDDVRQQQIAKAAGADSALLKGFPTAQLFATIERLLQLRPAK